MFAFSCFTSSLLHSMSDMILSSVVLDLRISSLLYLYVIYALARSNAPATAYRCPTSLRLLGKNQYTFNVESGFTKTEIKHWVELFFGVKVVAVNSHRLPGKGRRIGPILGHTMHYRRMIITLQPGYSIPLLPFKLKGILKEVFLLFSQ